MRGDDGEVTLGLLYLLVAACPIEVYREVVVDLLGLDKVLSVDIVWPAVVTLLVATLAHEPILEVCRASSVRHLLCGSCGDTLDTIDVVRDGGGAVIKPYDIMLRVGDTSRGDGDCKRKLLALTLHIDGVDALTKQDALVGVTAGEEGCELGLNSAVLNLNLSTCAVVVARKEDDAEHGVWHTGDVECETVSETSVEVAVAGVLVAHVDGGLTDALVHLVKTEVTAKLHGDVERLARHVLGFQNARSVVACALEVFEFEYSCGKLSTVLQAVTDRGGEDSLGVDVVRVDYTAWTHILKVKLALLGGADMDSANGRSLFEVVSVEVGCLGNLVDHKKVVNTVQ